MRGTGAGPLLSTGLKRGDQGPVRRQKPKTPPRSCRRRRAHLWQESGRQPKGEMTKCIDILRSILSWRSLACLRANLSTSQRPSSAAGSTFGQRSSVLCQSYSHARDPRVTDSDTDCGLSKSDGGDPGRDRTCDLQIKNYRKFVAARFLGVPQRAEFLVEGGRKATTKRVTLGRVTDFTPDEARKLADRFRARVKVGQDPQSEKAKRREAPKLSEVAEASYRSMSGRSARAAPTRTTKMFWIEIILPKLGTKRAEDIVRSGRSQATS